ncbi:MAG: dolichyl-phosphate beta-glucosyltransferase [Candidatus Woesebacteria bacterium]
MLVSIIFPSYNELKNIKRGVLDQAYDYLRSVTWDWELILADDGSDDGTAEKLAEFSVKHQGVRYIALPHRGKGPTVLEALRQAKGDYRLFSDFDQATPLPEIEKLFPFTQRGMDIVIGSREVQGSERMREPLHRHLMGKGFNFFVNLIAINGIHDTQCGFKLFSRRASEKLVDKVVVYSGKGKLTGAFTGAFDVELLYLAKKYKFKIAEVPINWTYAKTNRVDPIKDSLRMLGDIMRIRLADFQGKYR